MFRKSRCIQALSLSGLLLSQVSAQFGVGNRKQAQTTKFQELQELAKKQGGGGLDAAGGLLNGAGGGDAMADMQKILADVMNDPESIETLKQYGQQFSGVLDQMMKMSPDELQDQMAKAMDLMASGDVVETVLSQRESVLQALKASGTVTADELAKFEADPEYFELKMRESFSTMKDMFSNPEYINKAADAVKSIKGIMDNPGKISELMSGLGGDWTSEEKIEETRLQFLRGDFDSIPGFGDIFKTEEMQELLRDPEQWKELVKDGVDELLKLGSTATPSTGSISDSIGDEL